LPLLWNWCSSCDQRLISFQYKITCEQSENSQNSSSDALLHKVQTIWHDIDMILFYDFVLQNLMEWGFFMIYNSLNLEFESSKVNYSL
jgi:hypothetical protein